MILSLLVLFNSCKKIEGISLEELYGKTGINSGTATGDTYQPVSSGSYWKYTATTGTTIGHSVTTMNGLTATFNGKTYYANNNTSDQYAGSQISYFGIDNHNYRVRSTTLVYGITVDMIYLNDELSVGSTWTAKITDDGFVNGVPGRIVGKILETGISRSVSGKTFNNVIHTQVSLQYDYGIGKGFESAGTYDFFVAKNVGVIETDTNLSTFGFTLSSITVLTEYLIK